MTVLIQQKISEKIDEIKNSQNSNSLIEHQGVKGGLNENLLISLLELVIPKRYKLYKGIVENSKGCRSRESDIIIYDNDILPAFILNDLSFIPVESVKYLIEVKSTLNATELRTTIDKFYKFRDIGGIQPTILFAYLSDIKGCELQRYFNYESEELFYSNPSITTICIPNKGYYFKTIITKNLSDYLTFDKLIESLNATNKTDVYSEIHKLKDFDYKDDFLNQLSKKEFAHLIKHSISLSGVWDNRSNKAVVINGEDFNSLQFYIHVWYGVEFNNIDSEHNKVELSFLSGVANTLCQGEFGSYLLSNFSGDMKVFACCFEDMNGNLSAKSFFDHGVGELPDFKFTFKIREGDGSSNILFSLK